MNKNIKAIVIGVVAVVFILSSVYTITKLSKKYNSKAQVEMKADCCSGDK